jgi:hypothetical protein
MISLYPHQEEQIAAVKICINCKQEKILSLFGTRKRNSDGKRGRCKACERIDREKYLSGKGKEIATQGYKKWYRENREYCIEQNKKWRSENKEYRLKYSREHSLKKYGMTSADYERMALAQNNKCKICGNHKPNTLVVRFFIDHCHKTNIVRGLLCGSCNLGIGQFGDDTERMLRAIEYIKNNGNI